MIKKIRKLLKGATSHHKQAESKVTFDAEGNVVTDESVRGWYEERGDSVVEVVEKVVVSARHEDPPAPVPVPAADPVSVAVPEPPVVNSPPAEAPIVVPEPAPAPVAPVPPSEPPVVAVPAPAPVEVPAQVAPVIAPQAPVAAPGPVPVVVDTPAAPAPVSTPVANTEPSKKTQEIAAKANTVSDLVASIINVFKR